MKKFALALMTALAIAAASMPAQATVATNNFNVTINLTSKCEVVSVPTAAFTYTSFQTTNATFSSSFNIRCTNTLPISSIRLDDGAGGVASGLAQTYTDQATGLAYTLTLSTVPTAGNGSNQSVSLDGSMGLGQAGTCATATCANTASTNKQRTITITY